MEIHPSKNGAAAPVRKSSLAGVLGRALAIGSAWSLLIMSSTPLAAQESAENEAAPVLQEVVVTGSLIARPNAETAEAVTIVSTDDLKNEGVTTVEQALSLISANNNGNSYQTASAVTTFEGGGSFASLRGLGANKTLVLLDGQRLAANVVTGTGIDLDALPFAAIDHIEVLREGASSLYGTDAIAGVINFITRKNYDKGELDITGTKPQDGGGGGTAANLTFGHGNVQTDGYNLLVTGNYTYGAELRATQRPFSSTGFDPARGLVNTNGEGTTPGSYTDAKGNQFQVGYPACVGNPYLTRYYGTCDYEYSAAVDLIPKTTKESGLVALTKALPANNTVSIQYFYARSQVTTWGGPYTYGGAEDPGFPYYPTAANSTCAGTCSGPPDLTAPVTAYFTDAYNSRNFQYTNAEQRILLTFEGKNAGWDYSTAFNFSLNHNRSDAATGWPDLAIDVPGNTFNPLINPFGPQSAAGEAVIQSSYLSGEVAVGTYRQWSFNGHASHELGDAFGAGRAAAFAVGFDVRGEHIGYTTTPLAAPLTASTFFFPTTVEGARTEQAAYAELNVPVTKDFDFTISDRQDRYSDFGNTNNGKLSFRWQPFEMLTFRAAASTGFRAPTLFELYRPKIFGATGEMNTYPGCATGAYTAVFSALNCLNQGLALDGGNANLKPETSDNFDVGFIVEPIQNLGITVDWYRITIKNEIQQIPNTAIYANPTVFANNYVLNNAGTLTPSPAGGIDCAPSYTAPTCGYILQTLQNTGGISTTGFDLSAQYLLRTPIGKFRASLEGTLVTKFLLQEYLDGPQLNLDGQFVLGNQPIIRWSHQLNVDWTNGPFGAGINNHFVSSYGDFALLANGQVHTVGDYDIWGIYASWKPVDPMLVLVGVSNLFDTDPPFSNQGGGLLTNWQAGFNPLFSDPTGRAFYMRLKYEF
jgi:iron complex outermembrane recepter protein